MAYEYSALLGRIVEKVGTQAELARQIGLSERSLSLKLNNKVGWKQEEIRKVADVLEISSDEISYYFFKEKVQS